MFLEWIAGGVIALLVLLLVLIYNDLVSSKLRVDNSFAQMDVQLKRRNDLIPNLVETVKGYMKHERTVFENITRARSSLIKAGGVEEKAAASDLLTGALKTLFAVAENYPKLMANENFLSLQQELSSLEEKIAFSRQFYNDAVMIYNTKLVVFPSNVVAGVLGLREKPFFEAREAEKKVPSVKFG